MPKFLLVGVLLGIALTLAACGGVSDEEFEAAQQELTAEKAMVADLKGQLAEAQATPGAQAPRTLNALVGAGRDSEAINAFLPSRLRVRAGDTVAWKINSDEAHSVTFLSGGDFPEFAVPVPGGGPGELMLNPQAAFPTRPPGAPAATPSLAVVCPK